MRLAYYPAVLANENPLGPETGLTHFRAEGGESAFDRLIDTRFFYRGNAWFAPHAIRWMSRNDR